VHVTGGVLDAASDNLNATNLASGTVPDARFPATLPAASGANLTALNASNLSTGTVPVARYQTSGTWTPVLGGSGGTTGQTYATQAGHWMRTGDLMEAWFNITLSNKGTITGNLELQGLPVAIANLSGHFPQANMGYWQNLATSLVHFSGYGFQNGTFMELWGATAAAAALTRLTGAAVQNNTQLIGMIAYRVA